MGANTFVSLIEDRSDWTVKLVQFDRKTGSFANFEEDKKEID